MSFFTLSTGEQAQSTTSFEVSGGTSAPIPSGSILLVAMTEAKWDLYEGVRNISLRWDVVGKDYTKRVIFQKLRVCDADTKKRDRALMMLMAIDANTGSNLSKLSSEPTDADLQKMLNRKMAIKVDVWSMKDSQTGEVKEGNWVQMVMSAKDGGAMVTEMGGNPKPAPVAAKPQAQAVAFNTFAEDDDSEMPF